MHMNAHVPGTAVQARCGGIYACSATRMQGHVACSTCMVLRRVSALRHHPGIPHTCSGGSRGSTCGTEQTQRRVWGAAFSVTSDPEIKGAESSRHTCESGCEGAHRQQVCHPANTMDQVDVDSACVRN